MTSRTWPAARASLRGRGVQLVLIVAVLAAVALAGCGSDAPSSPVGGRSGAATDTPAAGDNGNGEGRPNRFVSSRYHYRVDAPGTMTENADGTATATRGLEQLSIQVITGPVAADPATFAGSDLSTAQSRSPQYQVITPLAAGSLGGHQVQKVVYSWVDGSNPVTGKPEALVTARYYIPKDATTLALVTYSIGATQYDPQGADDVAMTFQWQ